MAGGQDFEDMAGPVIQEGEVKVASCLYREGDVELEGVLARPRMPGKHHGVVVVHEWMGVGPYVVRRAQQLAQLGYLALAADVYGRSNRPSNTDEAGRIAQSFRNDPQLIRRRMTAAVQFLQDHEDCSGQIAAIGYCFGGTCVLELVRSGARLAGAVNLHGRLQTSLPAARGAVHAPIQILLGADDPLIPQESVQGFVEEMRQAECDWQLTLYGRTVHSFTNPEVGRDATTGFAYDPVADQRSWAAMTAFLDECFSGTAGRTNSSIT